MLLYLVYGISFFFFCFKFCMVFIVLLCFYFICGFYCWCCLEVVCVFMYRMCIKGYYFCFECWKGIEDKVIRFILFLVFVELVVEIFGMSSFLCERIWI